MNQEEYMKLRELGKLKIQRHKNLITLFDSKIDAILINKEEVIKKYAEAYLNFVLKFLENQNFHRKKGKITTRNENNIFGNYNISDDENLSSDEIYYNQNCSSYYEIYDDCILIVLKFSQEEDIKFNVNEDVLLYDELRINDILYEYGIDIQSRNEHPRNVIYIWYYKDKTKLKKNCEVCHTGHSLYTRKRTI